jgi:diguanylate cyclase (GGDEF)-like protein
MGQPRSLDVAQAYAVRLMQHLVVPTFVLNPRRRVVVWNRACERLTGVAASEVIGTTRHWCAFYERQRYCLADLVALGRPDKLGELYPEHTVPEDGLGFSAENWCVMPRLGNQLYLAIDAGPIHDEDGKLIAVVETLRDMTDQKRAETALKTLAASDGLTGLANRRSFDQTLAMEWSRAQRTKRPLSLLFVDVDHFKAYNDLHGHQKGDECLRAVAFAIGENALRPADLSARYGGEEFAVIMPETDQRGARKVAERLRNVLAGLGLTHGASGVGPVVTLSIGIATLVPSEELGSEWLLRQADQALYAAKLSGRNRVIDAEGVLAALTRAAREGDERIAATAG